MPTDGAVDHAPNRNDRRRLETRSKLIRAGREVIGEKGVDAATIHEITETADVGRGSFYNFFETKEDLVAAVIAESIDELVRFERSIEEQIDDPALALNALCRHGFEIASADSVLASFIARTQKIDGPFFVAFHALAVKVLEEGRSRGRFAIDDVELAYIMIAGITQTVMEAFRLELIPTSKGAAVMAGIFRLLGLEPAEADSIANSPLVPAPSAG